MFKPWLSIDNPCPYRYRTAAVIGAGLAGTGIALSLARRGWAVTLVEQTSGPATEASGNPAGVALPHVALGGNPSARISAHSYRFFLNRVQNHWQNDRKFSGDFCGVLSLAADDADSERQGRIVAALVNNDFPILASHVDAIEASTLAGVPLRRGGIFYKESGWVEPRGLCEANLAEAGERVKVIYETKALSFDNCDGLWHVKNRTGDVIATAEAVVLANAVECKDYPQTSWLQLFKVRGQTQMLTPTVETAELKTVISSDGYITPARGVRGGKHCAGATFDWKDMTPELRVQDSKEIVDNLADLSPAFESFLNAQPEGRVAYRCTSPDALPLVGPVPDYDFFVSSYSDMYRGRASETYPRGRYLPGMYLSVGHGSRGLMYSQWAGDMLAAQMSEETSGEESKLMEYLNPSRFLIRRFKQQPRS